MARKIFIFFLSSFFFLALAAQAKAMPVGTLLYRTSGDGNMFGYSSDELIVTNGKTIKNLYTGHVGIYVGKENGVDYVVEALPGGLLKVPAKNFINTRYHEKFLGAKIPKSATPEEREAAAKIALAIAEKNWRYDFDFKHQKGPGNSNFICVGLTEKVYESASLKNPYNLKELIYEPKKYAVDITADAFDNTSVVNKEGDCFSKDKEYSQISPRKKMILPAPEIWGYDAGVEKDGQRYFFLPYTQFLQSSLEDVPLDIEIESDFPDEEVRGKTPQLALVFKWSLINNPLSSVKNVARTIGSWFSATPSLALENNSIASTTTKVASSTPKTKKAVENIKYAFASVLNPAPVKEVAPSSTAVTTKNTKAKPSVISSIVSAVLPKSVSTNVITETKNNNPTSPVNNNYTTVINNPTPASSTVVSRPKLLISRLYTFENNDAIELYNPGNEAIDLVASNFRLEKAKTSSDPSIILRFNTASDINFISGSEIPARSYYLIVSSKASSTLQAKADAIAQNTNFALGDSGYTIYLGIDAISSFDDKDIVDMLGCGPEALYAEGSGAAPGVGSSTQFLARKAYIDSVASDMKDGASGRNIGAAYDSQDNSHDFLLVDTYVALVVVPEPEVVVNTSTSDEIVASTTPEIIASSSPPLLQGVVISRVHAAGDNDYIRLYNPNDVEIDLAASGYRLEKAKTASDPAIMLVIGDQTDAIYNRGTIIGPTSYYSIVSDKAELSLRAEASAVVTRSGFGLNADGYTIYLSVGPVSSSTDSDIVDLLGYGAAQYYSGAGPAPAIDDGYALVRQSFTGNNNIDFVLESELYEGAYVGTDIGQKIPNIINVWHFDECLGSSSKNELGNSAMSPVPKFVVGKWGCGYEHYGQAENPKTILPTTDLGVFTAVTTFKSRQWPRFGFTMSHSNNIGSYASVQFDEGYTEFCGFPGDCFRDYKLTWAPDDKWHQVALVVNSPEDYFAIYLDGREVYRKMFEVIFSKNFDNFSFSGANGWVYIDEAAIFSRALKADELLNIFLADKPFSPYISRAPQKPAQLMAHFKFDERQGLKTADSVAGNYFALPTEKLWIREGKTNGAIALYNDAAIDIGSLINFGYENLDDLSISFFYQDRNTPDMCRLGVRLSGDKGVVLGMTFMEYRLTYDFSGTYDMYEPPGWIKQPDSNWHHMALVYDSYKYKLSFYIDGVLKFQKDMVWLSPDTIRKVYINNGWNSPGLDELKVWRGALTPAEVMQESLAQ